MSTLVLIPARMASTRLPGKPLADIAGMGRLVAGAAAGDDRHLAASAEFREVGAMTMRVIDGLAANGEQGNAAVEAEVREQAQALVRKFPIYE